MERIKLSKDEKKVLRLVSTGKNCPSDFSKHIFNGCVKSLERKGFVKGGYISGGEVEAVRLTSEGRCYLSEYPNLTNPVNWGMVGGIGGIIAAIPEKLIKFVVSATVSCKEYISQMQKRKS